MPVFTTPDPILVTLEIGVGDIRIEAGDRADTVVEVRPTDPDKPDDVATAERTRVEYTDGRLLIKTPKNRRQLSLRNGSQSIDVRIALPAGSRIQGETGVATLRCTGPLGECGFTNGVGDIDLAEAGPVKITSGAGAITLGRARGRTEVTTGSGRLRIAFADGEATVKNSNGDTWIGEVTGDLWVRGANGAIAVERARAAVRAKTANGDITLGEVAHGAVTAQTGMGRIEVGVREGVAAWLDLNTGFGSVHNDLDAAPAPEPGRNTVEIQARTAFGDIAIHRAAPRQDHDAAHDDAHGAEHESEQSRA